MMPLRVLFRHYLRHPIQGLFLLAGIILANALLAGTLLINAQARASYDEGEQYLGAALTGRIRHQDKQQPIDEEDYIRLRRQGFDMLAPLSRKILRDDRGEPLELLGIDVFAMPRNSKDRRIMAGNTRRGRDEVNLMNFAYPPYQVWAAPDRLQQLSGAAGDQIELLSGGRLPPLIPAADLQLGHRMLIDIDALQSVSGEEGTLSSILVFSADESRLQDLRNSLPGHLRLILGGDAPDPARLTRSFHLNLAAMGLLSFVVGIFLIYNALAFGYTDRRGLVRKLRLAGVTQRELYRAFLLELVVFLVAGTLLGSWIGAQTASWLLPGVGRTLAQLYGVYIAYPDGLIPSGIWQPLVMTAAAACLCVLFPLRAVVRIPILEKEQLRWEQHGSRQRDRVMFAAGAGLLALSAGAGFFAHGLLAALAGMACLLLGAALLLPAVLRFILSRLARRIDPQRARLSWLLADSRWLLGPASLALMAMTLALVANSGLNTMINSFRQATDHWLDQRLASDLYLRGGIDTRQVESWIEKDYPGLQAAERFRTRVNRPDPGGRAVSVEIVSLQEGDRFRDSIVLIRAGQEAAARFENDEGVYISERAWRVEGWQPGELLELCGNLGVVPVLGVYHDYGNPLAQWMVSHALFKRCWPGMAASGLSIYGPEGTDWNRVRSALGARFGLQDGDMIDQRGLKAAGLALFDRTFTVTRALNTLTLLVAGIGIFCAVSAIHHHRIGQQALLASLGLSRRERGLLLLAQWGLLGLLCMVLVWPFGTALAAYLASVVTPVAFGWSFPLAPEWGHYAVLAALASASMILAVALPTARLLRISPAAMLREQMI